MYPWMKKAESKLGTKEILNGKVNPFVTECFTYTTYKTKLNEPWCAAFVAYCLETSALKSSKSAAAASYSSYGLKLKAPIPGCIVHIKHPGNHVTFFESQDGDYFIGLGGNQSNSVNRTRFKMKDIVTACWPVDAKGVPYPMDGVSKPSVPETTVLAWGTSGERSQWSDYLLKAIPTFMQQALAVTPKDADKMGFPVGGSDKQKIVYYAQLISIMAKYESSFNPNATYEESGSLAGVTSRGLLQISIDSANGYGAKLTDPKELHNPYTNLKVACLIMNRWVSRDGVISGKSGAQWLGGGRYWSVLRNRGQESFVSIVSYMRKVK